MCGCLKKTFYIYFNEVVISDYKNKQRIVEIWSEVYQERGEHIATIGVIQLILDRLKLSMRNNGNENDFQLPETIDLSTFDMENFISTITTNQVSWTL